MPSCKETARSTVAALFLGETQVQLNQLRAIYAVPMRLRNIVPLIGDCPYQVKHPKSCRL